MEKKRRSRRPKNTGSITGFGDGLEQGELEINIFKYEDFIEEDNEQKSDKEDENENDKTGNDNYNTILRVEDEKVSNVVMEGKMKKKLLQNIKIDISN